MKGALMLLYKEVMRFAKVAFQTILAPMITALLYLLVFSHVLEGRLEVFEGISYSQFLIPGLMMMSVIQNAFANSSSSLIQSKVTGNIIFVLLAPLGHWQLFFAYVGASVIRGIIVGLGVFLIAILVVKVPVYNIWVVIGFAILGSAVLGTMGIIAGIWADRYDQLAAFQNFLIMPLTFLSGVFYSLNSLPEFWQAASRFNPFFYMIDGFRYGFFGQSDIPVSYSFGFSLIAFVGLSILTWQLLRSGYKLRQ